MKSILSYIKKLFLQRYYLFACLILVITGILIYSNSFDASFQFDDNFHIIKEDGFSSYENFGNIHRWLNINKRSLSTLTLAINYNIHGYDVFGYHLVNLIIHILSSCLLFLLINQILRSETLGNKKIHENRHLIAFFCSLLFLIHPVQTQAVTYIIQRMTSMAGLFYIMSVYFYLKGRYSLFNDKKDYSVLFIILAVVSAIAGILSKQTALTIPIAWLLIELFFIRNKKGKPCTKYLISGLFIIVIAFVAFILLRKLPAETKEIGRYEYLITQFRVIIKYIQLSILPIQQNIDYDFPISHSLWGTRELLNLLLIIALIIAGVILYKKHRLFSFGIFWFLLTLSVESSIIPIKDVIFEHRLYLPVMGIILVLVCFLFNVLSKTRISYFIIVMMCISLFYGILTYARNEVWKTDILLWEDAVKKSPNKARVHFKLGMAKLKKSDYNGALTQFTKTIQLDSCFWEAYYNRGILRMNQRDYKNAIEDFSKFVNNNPSLPDAHNRLGKAKYLSGDIDGAIDEFTKAIDLDSSHYNAYLNRGNANIMNRDLKGAIDDFNKSIYYNKNNPIAFNNKGQVFIYFNQPDSALFYFNLAIKTNPQYAKAYFNRGFLLLNVNKTKQALNDFNKAIEINPKYTMAYKYRGLLHYKNKSFKKAYSDLQTAKASGADVSEELLDNIENIILKKSIN